jgi:arginase family enzyme
MTPLEELQHLLRPAGGGLHVVSTGRAEQLALQQRLYGASDPGDIHARWEEALTSVPYARTVVLGIPSDVGAGYVRGANLAPGALRTALLDDAPDFPQQLRRNGVVDLGDVFVCPQLLHDDMLSEAQLAASRRALYPGLPGCTLPVSPLSMAERALDLVFQLNPRVHVLMLGGDHSCAWPVTRALSKVHTGGLGIVQPDAHTDLLEERLGVRYCFATWSLHASRVLGSPARLVQVGTRASGKDQAHWERTTGVRQFWADACNRDERAALDAIVAALEQAGVTHVYFSNDVDGTDASWADATGTPEPGGLRPEFLLELLKRLSARFEVVAGDLVEVAPLAARTPGGTARTLELSVRYLRATLAALSGGHWA